MPSKQKARKQAKKGIAKPERMNAPKRGVKILPKNREHALISRVLRSPASVPRRHLLVQDLIYNTAREFQTLAFKSGFNLGSEAYRHSNRSISSLEHILENAGLGKVVYYPFESKSIITSRSIRSGGMNIGTNLHIFEAGVISGYMTAHTKKHISVREQTCVFNGASTCEFVATAGGIDSGEQNPIDFPTVVRTLSSVISGTEKQENNETYYMLSMKPLLTEPLFSEAVKFMYVTGKVLSRNLRDFDRSVLTAANLLGIGKAKLSKDRKGNASLALIYSHDTSINKYVDLSTALLAGMLKGAYGKKVEMTRSVDSKGIYNVRLRMLGNS
jgi:predicted hydrocarbon binding protein